MTTYPTGVTVGQNQQVPPSLWYLFNTSANCTTMLTTIQAATTPSPGTNTNMYIYDPGYGFVYANPTAPTVACYRYDCYGSPAAGLSAPGSIFMQENVAEIIDRQTVPNAVKNDMYVAGQGSPVLKVRKDSPVFGHLYWTYASNPYPTAMDELRAQVEEQLPLPEPKPEPEPEKHGLGWLHDKKEHDKKEHEKETAHKH